MIWNVHYLSALVVIVAAAVVASCPGTINLLQCNNHRLKSITQWDDRHGTQVLGVAALGLGQRHPAHLPFQYLGSLLSCTRINHFPI